jgi:lysophospholipase L1-like esterase
LIQKKNKYVKEEIFMATTVKTGWLRNENGDKFAPKTLISQVQTNDGVLLEEQITSLSETIEELKQNGTGEGTGADYSFLSGLKYYALGDSIVSMQGTAANPITFGDVGYTSDLQSRDISGITVSGYVTEIENRYGLVASNFGKAGHTLVGDYSELASKNYSDVALVTIAYGVNDARTGVQLGTVNSTDVTTFAGALNQLLRKIYTDNPECRVLVLAPLQRLTVTDFGIATPNANGNYLIDFVDMCHSVAEKRSTICIDQYRKCGINQTNLYYYTVEGVHPVNQGFARIKAAVIRKLDELFAVEYEPIGKMTNTGDTESEQPDTGGNGDVPPPEEDTGATEIDVASLLTMDGVYYDGWGYITGQTTHKGTPAESMVELIANKTYTLITYNNTNSDIRAGGSITSDREFTKGSYLKNVSGDPTIEEVASGVYKLTFTFVPNMNYPFLAIGCLNGYTDKVKLSYI